MKRALSIASVALVAAFVAGAMFLLPATLPREVIERSVVREQTVLEKAWHLPVASAFDRHVDFQSNQSLCGPASIANILRSFGEARQRKRFLLIRQVLVGHLLLWIIPRRTRRRDPDHHQA